MQQFIQKNAWGIIIALVAVSISWGVLNTKLGQVEAQGMDNKLSLEKYTGLVERIVTLEEHSRNTDGQISDLKDSVEKLNSSVDAIKDHFNIN